MKREEERRKVHARRGDGERMENGEAKGGLEEGEQGKKMLNEEKKESGGNFKR